MTKLYTITGENQTIRFIILDKSTKIMRKNKQIKGNEVVIQDWTTGETSIIKKNKLIFDQEFN